ncbi:MAG: response regulator [Anaerolineae bacterium]
MKQIRVLVVDDHPLMREALCAAIGAETDMEVAGEAGGGREAVEQARVLQPDVIVMDLLMPGMDGLEAIATIQAEFPQVRMLALTSSTEESKVLAAVQAGALGYLLKDAHREELLQAIRQVSQGNAYLPPQVALKLMHSVRESRPVASEAPGEMAGHRSMARLTPRQREVLDLLGQGLSNREIAERLVVSEATVRSHIYSILGKLGLESRGQAVAYAARQRRADQQDKGANGG